MSTPIYGGEKEKIKINSIRSIDNGDTSNNLYFEFPAHIGTHIDFPFHFSNSGKKCNDYPPSFWIFNKIGFLNCSIDEFEISVSQLPIDIEMLILKTGFGNNRNEEIYWSKQPVIPASFATILRNKFSNLRLFGFDMISLTSKLDRVEGKNAHLNFLVNNDILILEDMKLDNIYSTPKIVIVAPLQIKSADGVPCNVIAY
jgi:kynurenine formamidase